MDGEGGDGGNEAEAVTMAVDERVALDLAALEAAASAVPDPELPVVTLGDLGIVRGLSLADDGAVEVRITPTFVGCPATEAIAADVRTAVATRLRESGAPATEVRTRTTMSPPWSTDWISDDGRRKLREHGIAPPVGGARHAGGPVAVTIGGLGGGGAAVADRVAGSARSGGGVGGGAVADSRVGAVAAGGAAGGAELAGASVDARAGVSDLGAASDGVAGSAQSGAASSRAAAGETSSSPSPSPHPPTQPPAAPACPRCGSADTRELSAFGSTPCQSLRACRACGEPFGAVKSL